MAKPACRYCGNAYSDEEHRRRHERTCLHGPMLARVQAHIRSIAYDGLMPAVRTYDRSRHPGAGLPSANTIIRHCSWALLAESLGLQVRSSGRPPGDCPDPAEAMAFTQAAISQVDEEFARHRTVLAEDCRESQLLVARRTETKRIYCWRRRAYVVVLAGAL